MEIRVHFTSKNVVPVKFIWKDLFWFRKCCLPVTVYKHYTYVSFQEGARKKRMEMMERERKQREQVSLWTAIHSKFNRWPHCFYSSDWCYLSDASIVLKAFLLSKEASIIVFLSVDVVTEGFSDEEIWKGKGKLINPHKRLFKSINACVIGCLTLWQTLTFLILAEPHKPGSRTGLETCTQF